MSHQIWLALATLVTIISYFYLRRQKGLLNNSDYSGLLIFGILWLILGIFFNNLILILLGIIFAFGGFLKLEDWPEINWQNFFKKDKTSYLGLSFLTGLLLVAELITYLWPK